MGSKCDVCGHAEAVHGVDPPCDGLDDCCCTGFKCEMQDLRTRLAAAEAERDASDTTRREWEVRAATSYRDGRAAGLREAAGAVLRHAEAARGLSQSHADEFGSAGAWAGRLRALTDARLSILALLGPGEVSGG